MLALQGGAGESSAIEPRSTGPLQFVAPQKIACGNAHTLYLQGQFKKTGTDGNEVLVGSKVFGWGSNRHNQLGRHHLTAEELNKQSSVPGWMHPWPPTEPTPVDSVFVDQDPDGSLGNASVPSSDDKKCRELVEVACGGNYSMVLERKRGENDVLTESVLWAFGLPANGQLGTGYKNGHSHEPALPAVVKIQMPPAIHGRAVVQRVCCGTDHTLAIVNFVGSSGSFATHEGRVFAWGLNNYGALGTKSHTDEWEPREVWFQDDIYDDNPNDCFRVVHVRQVAAGFKHSLALANNNKGDGVVYAWGFGGNGRLGLGKQTTFGNSQSSSAEFEPRQVRIGAGSQMKYIAAGEAHSGAVDQLGGLYTWGQGSHGRCGHGLALDISTPGRVESLTGIAIDRISFGLMHSIATSMKGGLYAWGKGPATGLDAGDNAAVMTPRQVELPDAGNSSVWQIATGPLHTLVLMKDGVMYCFGSGSEHRMIKNLTAEPSVRRDQAFPRKLDKRAWSQAKYDDSLNKSTDDGASKKNKETKPWWPHKCFSNGAQSMVLLEDGGFWIWGSGKLAGAAEGENTSSTKAGMEPPPVMEPTELKRGFNNLKVKQVAAGLDHCLAVTEDGMMYSWGDGGKGQLGTGSLKYTPHPTPVSHPTEVKVIAAGEEHSACIIGGGESYTWGNAEGGRLGQGGCLSEGNQLQPKQVIQVYQHASLGETEPVQDVLLSWVSCGSQHTAFISEDNKLLTFGTGWFGRLGQGSLDNKYSPTFVKSDVKAKEVYCAMYHTCIVDLDGMLWVCGRDTSICCDSPDGDRHVLEPIQFTPFWEEPRRHIVSLATCEQHTLAVTKVKGDASTELWVWGKNSRGQLGISESVAARISSPWQLRLTEFDASGHPVPLRDGKKPNLEIKYVSTAPHHSVCIVRPRAKKGQERPAPIVYTWGLNTSGRLGVGPGLLGEKALKDEQAQNSLFKPPYPVNSEWKPNFEDNEKSVIEEDHKRGRHQHNNSQPSKNWYEIQQKLHREPLNHKSQNLEDQLKEREKMYITFMNDIKSLWSKQPGEVTEYNILQKERDLETQFVRTLKALQLGGSTDAPKLEGRIQTDKDILVKLHYYEELLWILQQQPCYLTNLASRLTGKSYADDKDVQLFHRICVQLFEDMKSSRTRNLFKALLKLIMEREMQAANSVQELFDPLKSRVARLFTQMCVNPVFLKSLAKPIVDPEDRHSLVSSIIRFTLSPNGKDLRWMNEQKSNEGNKPAVFITGVFVSEQEEYQNLDKEELGEKGDEEKNKIRTNFSSAVRDFNFFLTEQKKATEDEKKTHAPSGDIERVDQFIQRYIKDVLRRPENKDFQMLFVSTFETLILQRSYVISLKSGEGDSWTPEICTPLSALLISSLLGGVLEELMKPGAFALLRMKIRDKVKSTEKEIIREKQKDAKPNIEEEGRTEDIKILVRRVEWNISKLAAFFRRTVHAGMWAAQYPVKLGKDKNDTAKKEEKESRETANELVRFCNDELFQYLKEAPDGKRPFAEDTTETDMAVDLYLAHFSLEIPRVWVATVDLLGLANILHLYMEPDVHNVDAPVVRLGAKEKDRVAQLVKNILPRKRNNKGMEKSSKAIEEEVIPWDSEAYIWIANKIGEWHNFTMRSRFLEFASTGTEEPTFCATSKAPIPRSLAKDDQKVPKGIRVVKPFRLPDERGPVIEDAGKDIYPFAELERLLQDLAGSFEGENHTEKVRYPIGGKTFLDLRGHFEDFQREISNEMAEGRAHSSSNALLKRLEEAKGWVDKIRETCTEVHLRQYIDKEVKRRGDYFDYLEKMDEGSKTISEARMHYKTVLKKHNEKLTQINTLTETCEMPEEINAMAKLHSQRLAFARARRVKARTKIRDPTPAQRILEQLVRNSSEGKATEELKAMVGMPARSFKLRELETKGVITRVNEAIPKPVQKDITFTFQFENEGFTVQAKKGLTLLKEFTITRQDIVLMESARKCAILPYGEAFLWVNCFRLRRLLAWIIAEGGL